LWGFAHNLNPILIPHLKKFVNSLTAKFDEKSAADFLAIALLGFIIGSFEGTFLMCFISPNRFLVIYSALCIALLQLLC
jgi:fucose permease